MAQNRLLIGSFPTERSENKFALARKSVLTERTCTTASAAVFPGFLEFPGIGKFPGIGPNFPEIPGNLKKAGFSPYLEGVTVNLDLKHPF